MVAGIAAVVGGVSRVPAVGPAVDVAHTRDLVASRIGSGKGASREIATSGPGPEHEGGGGDGANAIGKHKRSHKSFFCSGVKALDRDYTPIEQGTYQPVPPLF